MSPKGSITKERILNEALGLMNRRGIESTSISDLQTATGMTRGSLYFHFMSKEALTRAVLEKAKAEFLVFLDAALAGKTPGEGLDKFFKSVVGKHKAVGFVGG